MGFELEEWKVIARAQQDNFQNLLGDRYWDRFQLALEINEKPHTLPTKNPKRKWLSWVHSFKSSFDKNENKCRGKL